MQLRRDRKCLEQLSSQEDLGARKRTVKELGAARRSSEELGESRSNQAQLRRDRKCLEQLGGGRSG